MGSQPKVIEKAARKVKQEYPDLNLVGFVDGYTSEIEQLARLQNMRADVLLVGMGMPKQELWIARNQKDLPFSVFLSGGAVFDYLSEEISRAPQWMRNRGLEYNIDLFWSFAECLFISSAIHYLHCVFYYLKNPLIMDHELSKRAGFCYLAQEVGK